MRTIIPAAIAVAATLVSSCSAPQKDDLALLIDRHTDARGGAAAIEAVRNIRTRVEIVEPTFSIVGDYRAKDGAMRIDIYAGENLVFSEGVDSQGAWEQQGSGAAIKTSGEKGRQALLHGIEFNLFGLHQLEKRGHVLSLEGDETLDGVSYKVIKVTLSDGFETYLYLDPETAMIARRRDVRALHPDADPTEKLIENQYFDFQDFCGVLSPAASRQIDAISGAELQTTKVIEQKCNLPEEDLRLSRDATIH